MTLPSWLRGLRASFIFFTRIPVGGFPYRPADWRWAAGWFPLVGLTIGALSAGVHYGLRQVAGPLVAAIAAIGAAIVATGAFHEDGLADTADALGSLHNRERIFAILKDSRLGTFGVLAVVLSVLARAALLAELDEQATLALPLAHALARTPPVWLIALVPYAAPSAASRSPHPLLRAGPRQACFASMLAALVMALAWHADLVTAHSCTMLVVVNAAVGTLCARSFCRSAGGLTGDFLGATQQLALIATLLGLVAVRS